MGIKHLFALQDRRAQYFRRFWLIRRWSGGFVSENTWTAGVAPGLRDVLYSTLGRYRLGEEWWLGWLALLFFSFSFFWRLDWIGLDCIVLDMAHLGGGMSNA